MSEGCARATAHAPASGRNGCIGCSMRSLLLPTGEGPHSVRLFKFEYSLLSIVYLLFLYLACFTRSNSFVQSVSVMDSNYGSIRLSSLMIERQHSMIETPIWLSRSKIKNSRIKIEIADREMDEWDRKLIIAALPKYYQFQSYMFDDRETILIIES